MRALVFVLSFSLAMLVLGTTAADTAFAFAALMSACIAAVVCTVATASGRRAGRRIIANLGTGWRPTSS